MKTFTRQIFILYIATSCFGELHAQSTSSSTTTSDKKAMIQFTYDDAGNRVKREIIYLSAKSNGSNTSTSSDISSFENENTIKGEDQVKENTFFENAGDVKMKLYPNPMSEQLIVEIENADLNTKNTLQIYDMSGKLMYSKEQLEQTNRLNFSPYINGPYIVKITIGDQQKEWVVVKQ